MRPSPPSKLVLRMNFLSARIIVPRTAIIPSDAKALQLLLSEIPKKSGQDAHGIHPTKKKKPTNAKRTPRYRIIRLIACSLT